jgi:hypothetical protein
MAAPDDSSPPNMTHEELKQARESLGLSSKEAAWLLDIKDPKSVLRMEKPPGTSLHRPPSARVVRLYLAYLAGYRPDDWPERLRGREERLAEIEEVRT